MSERWLPVPVPGAEEYYEVSDHGRVRRVRGGKGARGGHVMKATTGSHGYLTVCLTVRKNGVRGWHLVHRLVAGAFLGPIPDGLEVNHKNLQKQDNRPSNLEYVTPGENTRHGVRGNGGVKLSAEQVHEIRALREAGVGAAEIASQFGVAGTTVYHIENGATWEHLERAREIMDREDADDE